jgi:CSLREA domain-containing protein
MRFRGAGALTAIALIAVILPSSAVAASFSVTQTADTPVGQNCDATPTDCSLREAVTSAEGAGGADLVSVQPGIYTLSNGQLTVSEALTVAGAGASAADVTIDGDDASRIFEVAGGSLDLDLMTLANGLEDGGTGQGMGGAILAASGTTLTLSDAAITSSRVTGLSGARGGAIHSQGTVILRDSDLTHNTALASSAGNGTAQGGAVEMENGSLEVRAGSTIDHNTSEGPSAWGGGAFVNSGAAAIADSDLSENVVTTHATGVQPLGGGLYTLSTAASVDRSTVTGNRVSSLVTTAANGPRGGGIAAQLGSMTVTDSVIADNQITDSGDASLAIGGGIYSQIDTTLRLVRSEVGPGNEATGGEAFGGGVGLIGGTVEVEESTVHGNVVTGVRSNTTVGGGGIGATPAGAVFAAGIEVLNSTVAGNRVTLETPTSTGTSSGGGIFSQASSPAGTTIRRSTVTANSAELGTSFSGTATGGGISGLDGTDSAWTVAASIVSGNSQDSGGECVDADVTSEGYNVLAPAGTDCSYGAGTDDAITGSPGLDPLADNGGPTPTAAVQPGSPALDRVAIGSAQCPASGTFDQRGIARPHDAGCESGAFELGDCTVLGTAGKESLFGTAGDDVICGLGGNDNLNGLGGDDVLIGGDGNDRLVGGSGADALRGEGGADVADYSDRTADLELSIGNGADDGEAGEGDDVEGDVERLRGGSGDDLLIGSPSRNRLISGTGSDTLHGLAGADTLVADDATPSPLEADALDGGADGDVLDGGTAAAPDVLSGGGGTDLADYSTRTADLKLSIGDGANDGAPGENDNIHEDVERLRAGSGDDELTGSDGKNRLMAGVGQDAVSGMGGADTLVADDASPGPGETDSLDGGAGNDRMDPGSVPAVDVLAGGGGADTADYSSRSADLKLSIGDGANDGEPGEGDDIGDDVERLRSGSGDDDLIGNSSRNGIFAGAGSDHLTGGRGNDALHGETGDDTLDALDGLEFVDRLLCGAGTDTALADPPDLVDPDCES